MPNAATRLLRLLLAAILIVVSAPAFATAQRTFVSSAGKDTDPCSITLPCRGFSAAVAQATDGGEVIVLDSAGYGPVTIAKSVTIAAPKGIYAGITVFSGNGVTVSAANVKVALRGLSINGLGGQNGVAFYQGTSLVIERCQISNLADNGIVIFAPVSTTSISDTEVTGAGNSGLYADALAGELNIAVERSRFERNQWGLFVRQSARAIVRDSAFTGNSQVGVLALNDGGDLLSTSTVAVDCSSFLANAVDLQSQGDPNTFALRFAEALATRSSFMRAASSSGATIAASAFGVVLLNSDAFAAKLYLAADGPGASIQFTGGNTSSKLDFSYNASNSAKLVTYGNNSLFGGATLVGFTPATPN